MTRNTIFGQPLKFGDKNQIRQLEEFKQPVRVINYGGRPPYGEDNEWQCPCCTLVNSVRKIMPLSPQLGDNQMIRTPWIYYCRDCGQGCLFWREDNEHFLPDFGEDYQTEESKVLLRFVSRDEVIDLGTLAHIEDPIKFYTWKKQ